MKPVIKSYCLLCVSRLEWVLAYWQISNHICTQCHAYRQSFTVGTCIFFSAFNTNPLAQLVNYVAASPPLSCTSEEEKLFPSNIGAHTLNESFTQLVIYCKMHKIWKLLLRLWVFCLQKNQVLDRPRLHFVVLHLMEIKITSIAPLFMDNELKEEVQHISLEFLPCQSK